ADRRATAERVRAYRERKGNGSSNTVSNGVTNTVSNTVGTPAPTRPDPVVTKVTTEGARKRATPLPDSWEPTEDHRKRATDAGIDLEREVVRFKAWVDDTG